MKRIGVVGLGVVGGTVATAFKQHGIDVRTYDRYRPVGSPEGLAGCGVVFLCVPTPSGEKGAHDLTSVWSAIREVEPNLPRGGIVAVKSTVPPGTSHRLGQAFPRMDFVALPEFLVATRAMESFTNPDRVVVGANSVRAAGQIAELMSLVCPGVTIVTMTPTEAELVKLCSNAMLAAKVTMANELANVCQAFDVEWPRVQAVVGLDQRIGPEHMTVSPERGFGGACLPKDLDGLVAASREAGYDATVLLEIAQFNRHIRQESSAGQTIPAVVR